MRTDDEDVLPLDRRPFPPFPTLHLPVLSDAERAAAEARQRMQQRISRLERLDPPITNADRHRLIHGELAPSTARDVVQKWWTAWNDAWTANEEAMHPWSWLVLCGPPGTGKTLAGLELALTSGRSRYVGARKLEQVFAARFGEALDVQDELRTCQTLLVIDDLGREYDPELMGAALLELIDARRSDMRLTVCCANLTREQFDARYSDPRLQSRLAQSARWGLAVCDDMRQPTK